MFELEGNSLLAARKPPGVCLLGEPFTFKQLWRKPPLPGRAPAPTLIQSGEAGLRPPRAIRSGLGPGPLEPLGRGGCSRWSRSCTHLEPESSGSRRLSDMTACCVGTRGTCVGSSPRRIGSLQLPPPYVALLSSTERHPANTCSAGFDRMWPSRKRTMA